MDNWILFYTICLFTPSLHPHSPHSLDPSTPLPTFSIPLTLHTPSTLTPHILNPPSLLTLMQSTLTPHTPYLHPHSSHSLPPPSLLTFPSTLTPHTPYLHPHSSHSQSPLLLTFPSTLTPHTPSSNPTLHTIPSLPLLSRLLSHQTLH